MTLVDPVVLRGVLGLASEEGLLDEAAAPRVQAMPGQRRPPSPAVRFLTIPQVAAELAASAAQITALIDRGALPALDLDGRGQWRVERSKLEEFIARAYEHTTRDGRRSEESAVLSPT